MGDVFTLGAVVAAYFYRETLSFQLRTRHMNHITDAGRGVLAQPQIIDFELKHMNFDTVDLTHYLYILRRFI